MKSAVAYVLWGMLIVVIDVRLFVEFDLFADPIGYLLIAYGLHQMSSMIPLFRLVKWVAILLAVVSVSDSFGARSTPIFEQTMTLEGSWWELWVSGVLGEFASLFLIYILCEGSSRLAKLQGELGLLDHMRGSWGLYLISTAPLMILSPFLLNFDLAALPIILIIAGSGSFIGLVLILYGLTRVARDLDAMPPSTRRNPQVDIRV